VLASAGHLGAGDLRALPEYGPVVEVEHGVLGTAARGPGGVMGPAAGLEAQSGHGGPEDLRAGDVLEVEVGLAQVEVGCLRIAVEVEPEVIGREDLAEGHGSVVGRIRPDPPVVHAEAGDLLVQVPSEGVVTGGGDDGGVETVLGGGD